MTICLGRIRSRRDLVVWEMGPDDARELADFMEETLSDPRDMAHADVRALRQAAYEIDDKEEPEVAS